MAPAFLLGVNNVHDVQPDWCIHHAKLIYTASELYVLPCVHVYGTEIKITILHSHVCGSHWLVLCSDRPHMIAALACEHGVG